jgi:hypothetical protein
MHQPISLLASLDGPTNKREASTCYELPNKRQNLFTTEENERYRCTEKNIYPLFHLRAAPGDLFFLCGLHFFAPIFRYRIYPYIVFLVTKHSLFVNKRDKYLYYSDVLYGT